MINRKLRDQRGMIVPVMLVILAVFFVSATAIMGWAISQRKDALQKAKNTKALQVAEAGVDYYKWHLAHDNTDIQDGQDWCCDNDPSKSVADCSGVCGPYTEVYKDYNGSEIGEFTLTLKSPAIGSTIVEVNSVGKTYDSDTSRSVTAQIGKRSLARYSLLSDSPIWIGPDESTSGPLHSNGGIRFDGSCDAEVTSAVAGYDGSSTRQGFTGSKPGIWGAADAACQQYWDFPQTEVDFDLFTLDMAKIKSEAQAEGIYLGPSGEEGYHMVFQSDGTVKVSKVDSAGQPTKYYNDSNQEASDLEGIKKETLLGTYPMPKNGLIFVEDDLWTQGQVNGRVTVAVSRFSENPSNYARIVLNSTLTYLTRDGSDVLGLMAEGDILVPRHAPVPMVIDAVMLAQKGHVYTRDYKSSYKYRKDGSIQVYGGIISDLLWTWSYTDGSSTVDGYTNTDMIYDNHLTFSPPPSFPTEENFEVISWKEDD